MEVRYAKPKRTVHTNNNRNVGNYNIHNMNTVSYWQTSEPKALI